MWIQAGFAPDAFWHQTPLHLQLAMQGVRKRLVAENEAETRVAWTTAAFSGAAQAGKLKPLRNYLRKARRQTPQEMLAVLKSFQAGGAKMKIERFDRRA